MRARDLARFEKVLLEEKERVSGELAKLEGAVRHTMRESSGDLSAYAFHMADLGTDAMAREQNLLLAARLNATLTDIEDALRRIRSGAYGTCDNCGRPIDAKRLKALAFARLCLRCQEADDQGKGATGSAGRQ